MLANAEGVNFRNRLTHFDSKNYKVLEMSCVCNCSWAHLTTREKNTLATLACHSAAGASRNANLPPSFSGRLAKAIDDGLLQMIYLLGQSKLA